MLLAGRFEYQGWGILDRTHLRFFTLDSAFKLFEDAGLEVLNVEAPTFYGGGFLRRFTRKIFWKITPMSFHSPTFVFRLKLLR
jgi:hypothetical protein